MIINRIGSYGKALVSTLVLRTAGTAIGNATSAGGLAAAFDGNESQASGACAAYYNLAGPKSSTGYIGKNWGVGVTHSLSKAEIIGSTSYDCLYRSGSTCYLVLEGSTDNFSSSIVTLASTSFLDPDTGPHTYTITPPAGGAAYRYHRVSFQTSYSGNDDLYIAEVKFYEWL